MKKKYINVINKVKQGVMKKKFESYKILTNYIKAVTRKYSFLNTSSKYVKVLYIKDGIVKKLKKVCLNNIEATNEGIKSEQKVALKIKNEVGVVGKIQK